MALILSTRQRDSVLVGFFLLIMACMMGTPPYLLAKDVSFQWTPNQEPVSGYKLYYQTGDEATEPFNGAGVAEGDSPIILGDVSSFIVTGLSDQQTYHFALTAFNEHGESDLSPVVTIGPGPVNTKDVSFSWRPNEDSVTGYKLYYKIGGNIDLPFDGTGLNEGPSPILVSTGSSFTVSGLSPDTTYHFALTAYNDYGESEFSEIVTISSEPVPIIINISSTITYFISLKSISIKF